MSAARDAAVGVVRLLRERGHVAYFAGGCVRDELLGFEPEDYDVATDATPEEVKRAHGSVSEVGASFGVMLVRERGQTIEVATFRTEGVYTDKRRPDAVEYADAPSDAKRRDFTINAMFLDPLAEPTGVRVGEVERHVRGEVIDYVGGVEDLSTGVVRAVGDPEQRLAEDHLRALRAVRFTARFGFALDEKTAHAIREHARDLEGVSAERVGEEVRRMLEDPNRARAVALLNGLGLDGPALQDGRPGDRGVWLSGLGTGAGSGAALAAWAADRLGDGGPPWADGDLSALVSAWRKSLSLSNEARDSLRDVLRGVGILVEKFGGAGVARQKRWASSTWFAEALDVLDAGNSLIAQEVRTVVGILGKTPGGLRPEAFLDGSDLLEIGFQPGRKMGRVLDELYDLQLTGALIDRKTAFAEAQRLFLEEDGSEKGHQPKGNPGV